MAIAYNTSSYVYGASASSASFDLGCSGSDRLAVLFAVTGGGDRLSSITVEGVSATFIAKYNIGAGNQHLYAYYYIAPPTSATTTYQINAINAADDVELHALIYTGAKQSGQPDSSNTGSGSPNVVASTTVVSSNCWLASISRNTATGDVTPSTGTTQRQDGALGETGDSNGTVGTGAQTMQWNSTSGTSYAIIISFNEATGSAIKTVDGLAIASVKTVDGLAIASVKTINGLD